VTPWIVLLALGVTIALVQGYRRDTEQDRTQAQLEHTTLVLDVTVRRDRADRCVKQWEIYVGRRQDFIDSPQALINFVLGEQTARPPTPEQQDRLRATFAALFDSNHPVPTCDLEAAQATFTRTQAQLDRLTEGEK
jgi:hypothetical protein